jgi:hypothetical protein
MTLKGVSFDGLALLMLLPLVSNAQSQVVPDAVTIEKAKVLEVSNERTEPVAGTNVSSQVQTLKAEVIDGPDKGHVVTFENDFTQLDVGDLFYIRHRAATSTVRIFGPFLTPIASIY